MENSSPRLTGINLNPKSILIVFITLTILFTTVWPPQIVTASPSADTFSSHLWQTVIFNEVTYEIWLVLDPDATVPAPNTPLEADVHYSDVKSIYVTKDGDRLDDPVEEFEVMFLAQNNLRLQDPAVWNQWSTHLDSTGDGELITTTDGVDVYIPIGMKSGTRSSVIDIADDFNLRVELYKQLLYQIIFPALDQGDIADIEQQFDEDMGASYEEAIRRANQLAEPDSTNDQLLQIFLDNLGVLFLAGTEGSKLLLLQVMHGGVHGALFGEDVIAAVCAYGRNEAEITARGIATIMYIQSRGYDRLESLKSFISALPPGADPAIEQALSELEGKLAELHEVDDISSTYWKELFAEFLKEFIPDPENPTLEAITAIGSAVSVALILVSGPASVVATAMVVIWKDILIINNFIEWASDGPSVLAQAGLALTLEDLLKEVLLSEFAAMNFTGDLIHLRDLLLSINHRLYCGYLFHKIIQGRMANHSIVPELWFEESYVDNYVPYKLQARFFDYTRTLPLGYLETPYMWMGARTRGPAITQVAPDNFTDFYIGEIIQWRVQFIANSDIEQGRCRLIYLDNPSIDAWLPTDTSSVDGWGCDWDTTDTPAGFWRITLYVDDIHGYTRSEDTAVRLIQPAQPIIQASVSEDQPTYLPGETVTLDINLFDGGGPPVTGAALDLSIEGSPHDCSESDINCSELGSGQYSIAFPAPAALRDYDIIVNATKSGYLPGSGGTSITVYEEVFTGHDVTVNQVSASKSGDQIHAVANVFNNGTYTEPSSETIQLTFKLRDPNGIVVDTDDHHVFLLAKGLLSSNFSVDLDLPPGYTDGSYTVEVTAEIQGFTDQNPADNKKTVSKWVGDKPDFHEFGLQEMWGYANEWAQNSTGGDNVDGYRIFIFSAYDDEDNNDNDYATVDVYKGGDLLSDGYHKKVYFNKIKLFDGNQFAIILDTLLDSSTPLGAVFEVGMGGATGISFTPGTAVVPAGMDAVYRVVGPSEHRLRYFEVDQVRESGDDFDIVSLWEIDNDPGSTSNIQDVFLTVPADAIPRFYEYWMSFDDRDSVYDRIIRKLFVEVLPVHDLEVVSISPSGTNLVSGSNIPFDVLLSNNGGHTEYGFELVTTISGPNSYEKIFINTISSLAPSASTTIVISWNSSGLPVGVYTISSEVLLSEDGYPLNNSTSSSNNLTLPPQLNLSLSTDQATYTQLEPIEITGTLTLTALPVTDATITYFLKDSSDNTIDSGILVHQSGGVYTKTIAAPIDTGTYSITASATKSGHLTDYDEVLSLEVEPAPPQTNILNNEPAEASLVNYNDLQFDWIGTDISAPASQLEYSHKLDDGVWSAFDNSTSVNLIDVADGSHTFYVKTKVTGGLEDPTPDSRSFTIDTTPPVFESLPQANAADFIDGDLIEITVDLDSSATPSSSFISLDSEYAVGMATISETDPGLHTYLISYSISLVNTRSDNRYSVTISAEDATGNTSSESILLILDNSAPSILSKHPDQDDVVPVGTQVEVQFSEPMDEDTVATAFSISPNTPGTISWIGNTFIYQPENVLTCEQLYTLEFDGSALDLLGKVLSPISWTFNTDICGFRVFLPLIMRNYESPLPMLLAPSGLDVSVVTSHALNLSWTDNSSDETAFHIERSPSGADTWAEIDTVGADIETYADSGLTCGTAFDYRVRAYRSSDSQYSDYSNVDSATTGACSAITLFEEDWESGILTSLWQPYGSPAPSADAGQGRGDSIAVDPNGDASWDSGLLLKTPFDMSNGLRVEFWMKGEGSPGTAYAGASVGLSTCTPADNLELCGNMEVYIAASAEANTIRYKAMSEYREESYTPLQGEWHKYRFDVYPTGHIAFYRDDLLQYLAPTPLDFDSLGDLYLRITGRSLNSSWYIDDIIVTSLSNVLVEEFDSAGDFISTDPDFTISGGKAHWTYYRNAGQQYLWRAIPHYNGDVRLLVTGQIDSWTNNCQVRAGIGSALNEIGESARDVSLSVNYGFYGGGCATNGTRIGATGATLDYHESGCVFTGNWLWISPSTSYSAELLIEDGAASLTSPGVNTSLGTPYYAGDYDILFVGDTGWGDPNSCSGSIESILVEFIDAETLPQKPTSLAAVPVSDSSMDLSWTDNSTDETAFHIERSLGGADTWVEIDMIGADITAYNDSSLTCGTAYDYRVRAFRSGDSQYSDYSNVATAQTDPCAGGLPFTEDWEAGIQSSLWQLYGSPAPTADTGQGRGGSIAVDPNGDASWDSGLLLKEPFDTSNGVSIEYWMKGDSPLGESYSGLSVGLSTCTPSDNLEQVCHAIETYIEAGVTSGIVRYHSLGEDYSEPYAPLNGEWHKYRIDVFSSGHVAFYRDDVFKHLTSTTLDLGSMGDIRLRIRDRSVNSSYYVDDIVVTSMPGVIVEEFDNPGDFTSTDPDFSISGGKAHWTYYRDAGQQYLWRPIPNFSGDVRLLVTGQIDSWTNNCQVRAGIGSALNEVGQSTRDVSLSVNYGFYGGGCATNGTIIDAAGATLDYHESGCVFTGNWLWISPGTPYTAELLIEGGAASLSSPDVNTSVGTPYYTGDYDLLFVGDTGWGDPNSCSGSIERIIVEPLSTP